MRNPAVAQGREVILPPVISNTKILSNTADSAPPVRLHVVLVHLLGLHPADGVELAYKCGTYNIWRSHLQVE